MNEEQLRKDIRIMIAAYCEKYAKIPFITWMGFENAIVALFKQHQDK